MSEQEPSQRERLARLSQKLSDRETNETNRSPQRCRFYLNSFLRLHRLLIGRSPFKNQ